MSCSVEYIYSAEFISWLIKSAEQIINSIHVLWLHIISRQIVGRIQYSFMPDPGVMLVHDTFMRELSFMMHIHKTIVRLYQLYAFIHFCHLTCKNIQVHTYIINELSMMNSYNTNSFNNEPSTYSAMYQQCFIFKSLIQVDLGKKPRTEHLSI